MIQKYVSQIFTFLLIAFLLSVSSAVIFENEISLWLLGITGTLYGGFAFYYVTIGTSAELKALREKLKELKNE